MPWGGDGKNGGDGDKTGGPWRQGGGGPWGQAPNPRPPDLEEWLRRAQERLRQWLPGGIVSLRSLFALAVLGVGLWLLSGFYVVGPNQVGLNMIFGRYTGKTESGLNYNLPFPVGSVKKLDVTDRNATNIGFVLRPNPRHPATLTQVDLPEESLMLAANQNIADVKFVVIWQIDPSHPEYYAFNVADPRETVKAVAESAMREVVGRTPIQKILTAGRKAIEPEVQALMQKILNSYKIGVLVLQVQLQSVEPPEQVIAAFRDVIAAQQDADRIRNEAQAYANRVVPTARGAAAAIIQKAKGYRDQVVAEAKGQAARFDEIYAQYKKAPEVTRERIYLETMEDVLGGTSKVILDSAHGAGVVPYLPLSRLAPQTETGAPK